MLSYVVKPDMYEAAALQSAPQEEVAGEVGLEVHLPCGFHQNALTVGLEHLLGADALKFLISRGAYTPALFRTSPLAKL